MTSYKPIMIRHADHTVLVRCKIKSIESGKQFTKVIVPYSLTVMKGPEFPSDDIIDQSFASAVAVRVAVKRAIRKLGA